MLRGGSEKLSVLLESLGASEDLETPTARLTESPRSHSPTGCRTPSGVLQLQQKQHIVVRVEIRGIE